LREDSAQNPALARDFAKKQLKTPAPENLRIEKMPGSPTANGVGSFTTRDYLSLPVILKFLRRLQTYR